MFRPSCFERATANATDENQGRMASRISQNDNIAKVYTFFRLLEEKNVDAWIELWAAPEPARHEGFSAVRIRIRYAEIHPGKQDAFDTLPRVARPLRRRPEFFALPRMEGQKNSGWWRKVDATNQLLLSGGKPILDR